MTAKHYYFIFQIGPGNLGNRVVAHEIGILPFDRQIDRHRHLFSGLNESSNSIVMFDGEDDLRNDLGRAPIERSDLPRCSRSKRRVGNRLRHSG